MLYFCNAKCYLTRSLQPLATLTCLGVCSGNYSTLQSPKTSSSLFGECVVGKLFVVTNPSGCCCVCTCWWHVHNLLFTVSSCLSLAAPTPLWSEGESSRGAVTVKNRARCCLVFSCKSSLFLVGACEQQGMNNWSSIQLVTISVFHCCGRNTSTLSQC